MMLRYRMCALVITLNLSERKSAAEAMLLAPSPPALSAGGEGWGEVGYKFTILF